MPFHSLDQIKWKELLPGFRVRFLHTKHMTLAFWNIDAGAELPEHSHPHEQVASIQAGEFELNIEGEMQVLKPGQIATIPGNKRHSGKALTDCEMLDIFSPVREEYL